jgi:hypothetical protein
MKIGQPAVQNLAQFLARGFDPPIGQIRQFRRTRHPRDHRFYHPPSAKAENIADHRVELDVGLFQRLLNPLDVAGLLAGHLLVRAAASAAPGALSGNEARLDQATSRQIGDPHRVVDVRIAAGDVLDVGRVRRYQFEVAVAEDVP